MFGKVLIANRGEIAVRLIRCCRKLGIRSVAVFSEADRAALHLRFADEAYCIGPPPAGDSYLNIARIIEVARRSGAHAVHPGYGFLSESPTFAAACEQAGITFIGPPPAAMEALGSKTASRVLAGRLGVPLIPGTGLLADAELPAAAEALGYPVVVKAAAGGGGKGMRVVHAPADLDGAARAARSEGQAAFGSDALYLEKYLLAPRHVEVQVLADTTGETIALGDRDCSVQRRHQKVIEEAPALGLSDSLRRTLWDAAVTLATAAGYVTAGTCEFLVTADGRYYFLEANPRLQVEHPVTELVTGLDLVEAQLRIAAGEPLRLTPDDCRPRGHALECRIYAEDPFRGFTPCPGRVQHLREPGGPGVRLDSGIYEGYEVPGHYDPLIAKLCTWGRDRGEAVAHMARALQEYSVQGLATTIPFHRRVMADPRFQAGPVDTTYLDTHFPDRPHAWDEAARSVALIAAALHAAREAARRPAARAGAGESPWVLAARQAAVRRGA